jgi:hypothetical protein
MKINKYLIIFLIILIIIIFLFFINYLFKYKPIKINIENFYPENKLNLQVTKKINNNLIINGSFENSKDSPNHVNQNGYNKIIMKKNPGKSSYVLEQKKTDQITYYEFICKNVKNSKYNLFFWLSVNNNNANIDTLDFEKLIKIKIQNNDFSNYIPKLNYNIIQKVILSNNDNIWYLVKYDFISDNNTSDKIQIYLNYSIDLQFDAFYFTDISLYRVLIDAENFIYNDDLISYSDSYSYESNNTTWRDLSGNGNDLFWSNIPITDYTKGSINTDNMKLSGFSSNKISNNKFSILFCLNKNIVNNIFKDNNVSDEDENNELNEIFLISIPGNDRYSFEIQLQDNYLYIVCGKDKYKSKNEIILYNKSLLSIQYDNGTINIIHDGINILTANIRKIYFSEDSFIINRNKNLNYNFYSILFYNRLIDADELNDIREYFITNKNKNFNNPDINIHHMNTSSEYTVNNNQDNYLFKPYNNKINNNSNVNSNFFTEIFDNQNNIVSNKFKSCSQECLNLCLSTSADNLENFLYCTNNCKNTIESCKDICLEEENNNSIYCNNNIINNDKLKCPKVYKKNGKYMVYIPPDSYYSQKLNYSGERSYGTNIDRARYTYHINFPKCPIPNELIVGSENKYIDTCPYIINELNPCYTTACGNVNWNVANYNDLNLNKNCKKAVSNYCQINYNLDENCFCWDPKNRDDPKCIEFRRYFENPYDYCSPSQFKIEDHPDFNKYIKKDNIPCWGCNIDT